MRRLDCLYRSQTPTLKSDCSEQVASWNVHGPASCPALSPSSFRSLCSDVPFPGGAAAGRGAPSLSLKLHSPFYPWLNPLSLSATYHLFYSLTWVSSAPFHQAVSPTRRGFLPVLFAAVPPAPHPEHLTEWALRFDIIVSAILVLKFKLLICNVIALV